MHTYMISGERGGQHGFRGRGGGDRGGRGHSFSERRRYFNSNEMDEKRKKMNFDGEDDRGGCPSLHGFSFSSSVLHS